MGNNWQALRILAEVIEQHADAAPSFPTLYTLNAVAATALGAFHRLHGLDDADELAALLTTARDAAERALVLVDEFDSPVYRVAVEGNLAEVLTYQGDLDAAHTMLHAALELANELGVTAHADRVRASIGAWLVTAGRCEEALTWLDRLIADVGDDGPHSTRIRAHHAAYLAARALGNHELALAHHEIYERLERRRATNQLRAQSAMFVTRIEADAEVERHRATAERDPLTGLGNRRRLAALLQDLVPTAAEGRDPFALAVLDLDEFKSVNDEYGHAIGDAVLVELARFLDRHVDRDTIVRFGGEEIVIVFPGLTAEDAFERCEHLRAALADRAWDSLPADRRLTVSIGVAGAPPYDGAQLLDAADRSLYCAKRAGRNLVYLGAAPHTE
jgi:diguanylate cyclase